MEVLCLRNWPGKVLSVSIMHLDIHIQTPTDIHILKPIKIGRDLVIVVPGVKSHTEGVLGSVNPAATQGRLGHMREKLLLRFEL
eukprot:scaffold9834_cov22-Tisochrysis_lutea.AAC.1